MANIGPIPSFLDKISNSWDLSFIFTKIWAVNFSPSRNDSSTLGQSIYAVLKKYNDINKFTSFVNSDSNLYKDLLSSPTNLSVEVASNRHFILANKISVPEESVFVGSTNIPIQEMAGGAIWGRFGGSRYNDSSRTVDITFLDTNRELIDLIIKPWIIAVAHQGLISANELPNLKCDIKAYFFAKSSPRAKTGINKDSITITSNYPQYYKSQSLKTEPFTWASQGKSVSVSSFNETEPCLRKVIIFKNCVPISVPQKNYNYANDMGNDETMTEVKFSYDWYEVNIISNLTQNNNSLVSSPEGTRTELNVNQGTINSNNIGSNIS